MSSPALSEESNKAGSTSASSGKRHQQEGPSTAVMDSDGLISYVDVVQARVREMVERHRCEVQLLKREIYMARQRKAAEIAAAQGSANGGLVVGVATNPGAAYGMGGSHFNGVEGEDVGINRNGSTTSETPSWENVDEKEARPTLWIPDHASTSCMK